MERESGQRGGQKGKSSSRQVRIVVCRSRVAWMGLLTPLYSHQAVLRDSILSLCQLLALDIRSSMSNSLSGPASFADDGSAVISRQIEANQSRLATKAQDKISFCLNVYEIDRTVNIIIERGFKRVSEASGPTSLTTYILDMH